MTSEEPAWISTLRPWLPWGHLGQAGAAEEVAEAKGRCLGSVDAVGRGTGTLRIDVPLGWAPWAGSGIPTEVPRPYALWAGSIV